MVQKMIYWANEHKKNPHHLPVQAQQPTQPPTIIVPTIAELQSIIPNVLPIVRQQNTQSHTTTPRVQQLRQIVSDNIEPGTITQELQELIFNNTNNDQEQQDQFYLPQTQSNVQIQSFNSQPGDMTQELNNLIFVNEQQIITSAQIQSFSSQPGLLTQELNGLIFGNGEVSLTRPNYLPDNNSETEIVPNVDENQVNQATLPEQDIPDVEELCQRAVSSLNILPLNFQQALPFIEKFLHGTNQRLKNSSLHFIRCEKCSQKFKRIGTHRNNPNSSNGCYRIARLRYYFLELFQIPHQQDQTIRQADQNIEEFHNNQENSTQIQSN